MKTFEKGQDKIQKISEQLKREVLEPAQDEARKIVEEAKRKATHINSEAEKQADELIHAGRKVIEQERNVFYSSLQQASKQVMEALRQSIEKNLFNEQLNQALVHATTQPQAIADLIAAIVKAIEKEGISVDISAVIPKAVSAKEVNDLLIGSVLQKLKGHSVTLDDFAGGVKIKLENKNLTIDMSEETLRELMSRYIRKDFRKLMFGNPG